MIVVDTNLLAYLLIPGDRTDMAERVLRKDDQWSAPLIWRSELRNVLVKLVRGGIVEPDRAFMIMTQAESMMNGCEYDVVSGDVLSLALSSGCSAYDAEFVVLARDLAAPLVTWDKKILAGFPDMAVSPEGFEAR